MECLSDSTSGRIYAKHAINPGTHVTTVNVNEYLANQHFAMTYMCVPNQKVLGFRDIWGLTRIGLPQMIFSLSHKTLNQDGFFTGGNCPWLLRQ